MIKSCYAESVEDINRECRARCITKDRLITIIRIPTSEIHEGTWTCEYEILYWD